MVEDDKIHLAMELKPQNAMHQGTLYPLESLNSQPVVCQFSLQNSQMETLSNCVSSNLHLNKPLTSLHPPSSSDHLHFISYRPPTATTTTATSFLSSSCLHSSLPPKSPYSISGNVDSRPLSPVRVHRKAATGYAAALIDAAQCNRSLGQVKADVHRLSLLLRSVQLGQVSSKTLVSHADKERILQEITKRGGFHRHLVALLKMFVRKNQVEMVGEVLEEFKRIYRDMMSRSGTALPSQGMKRSSITVDETSATFAM